ncbi:MAG: helix-turn-helix transcriptional regulator [Bacillota bacterium]|nr:helix-turn-helix transcriptional regulator [Bacillota bacterium]
MYKAARLKAGLSREEAAHRLHIGSRTLVNYENLAPVPPADVVANMRVVYSADELPANHCTTNCQIGQIYAYKFRQTDLALDALRLINKLKLVNEVKPRLVEILMDGRIDEHEHSDYKEIIDALYKLGETIFNMRIKSSTHVCIESHSKEQKELLMAK